MASEAQHHYTLEEYFALELASEEKYEFWDGEVFCMSGASLAHNQIAMNQAFLMKCRNKFKE